MDGLPRPDDGPVVRSTQQPDPVRSVIVAAANRITGTTEMPHQVRHPNERFKLFVAVGHAQEAFPCYQDITGSNQVGIVRCHLRSGPRGISRRLRRGWVGLVMGWLGAIQCTSCSTLPL